MLLMKKCMWQKREVRQLNKNLILFELEDYRKK